MGNAVERTKDLLFHSNHCGLTKFLFLAKAVPYWVDDESVRASMAASGPSPARSIEGCVFLLPRPAWCRTKSAAVSKARKGNPKP